MADDARHPPDDEAQERLRRSPAYLLLERAFTEWWKEGRRNGFPSVEEMRKRAQRALRETGGGYKEKRPTAGLAAGGKPPRRSDET